MDAARKQLLEAYHRRSVRRGVFRVRCTEGGPVYLGAALDLDAIWNRHRFQLDLGAHPQPGLQRAWASHGPGAFVFETVAELSYPPDEEPNDLRGDLKALLELCLSAPSAAGCVKIE